MNAPASRGGFWTVLRAQLRTGWLAPTVWIFALAGGYAATVAAVNGLYGTPAQLAGYNDTVAADPAMAAINGTPYGADTLGGVVSNEFGFIAAIAIPLMGLLLVVRQTRTQEERGMLELLRSRGVGIRAPWSAALLTTTIALALVGASMTATLLAFGEDLPGAVTYGASMAALGLVFAGIAVFAGQLFRRGAGITAIGIGVLGAAYITRAVGDVRGSGWKWLSPLAWQQETRPFTDDLRLWPLLLSLGVAILLVAAGLILVDRRDLGAALFASRPGPARGGGTLRTTPGVAVRMQAPTAAGWIAGAAVIGLVFGAFTGDIADAIASNPQLAASFPDPADANASYIGLSLLLIALMSLGVLGQGLSRTRAEESEGRLESVLARAVSRPGWSSAQFLTSAVTATLTLIIGGAALELTAGDTVDGIPAATLAYIPAVLLVAGIAWVLFGLLPRLSALIWAVVGYVAFVAFLGETLKLPDWALNMSPLYAVGTVPVDEVSAQSEWVLTVIAVVLCAAGIIGFRRRDTPR
ncbi:ABC transporter permease [Microbacterium sp. B2969]|uniref:ABC transporter permease n=1 Tax=Microbacterium alkaliflavum TaxID=3248839 RepID=A0ABW7Q779_9MICO